MARDIMCTAKLATTSPRIAPVLSAPDKPQKPEQDDITRWLLEMRAGSSIAKEMLAKSLYDHIYRIATKTTKRFKSDASISASVLANEVYIKLATGKTFERAENRIYLYVATARAMREVIADHFAQKYALKRKPPGPRVPIDQIVDYFVAQDINVTELRQALEELEVVEPRKAAVVQARFFLGDTMQQVADRLGISLSTAESDLRLARAWLYNKLKNEE